jgi:hypothetical protein
MTMKLGKVSAALLLVAVGTFALLVLTSPG